MILSEALASDVSPEQRTKSPVELRPTDDYVHSSFAAGMVVKTPAVKQEAQVL